jgi:hypothetical protein
MKAFTLLILLNLQLQSQDSLQIHKPKFGSVSCIVTPMWFTGYTFLATAEKYINRSSISVGFKSSETTDAARFFIETNQLALLEYRYYFPKSIYYLGSYLKYRFRHTLYEYCGGGCRRLSSVTNSIAPGIVFGEVESIDNKNRFFINSFVGIGWFHHFENNGYAPSSFNTNLDLRVGNLVGYEY